MELQQRERTMASLTEETHRLTATVDMLQLELEQANAGVSNLNATHKVEKDELNRNIKEKEELIEGLQQMNTQKMRKFLSLVAKSNKADWMPNSCKRGWHKRTRK